MVALVLATLLSPLATLVAVAVAAPATFPVTGWLTVGVVLNLNDSWAGNSVVVGWDTAAGEDEVLLALLGASWDGDLVVGARALEWGGDWAHGGNEVGLLGGDRLGGLELEAVACLDRAAWAGHAEGWESLDWERWVALGAGGDELRCEGVDLVEVKRNVESVVNALAVVPMCPCRSMWVLTALGKATALESGSHAGMRSDGSRRSGWSLPQ